jgi:proteasome lid subunit RPN8/RPN11
MSIEIVSETQYEIKLESRPEASIHPWCPTELDSSVPIYIDALAADQMFAHCLSEVKSKKEVMGLLIGELFHDDEGNSFGIVRETATSSLSSDNVSVRFSDFGQLMSELDGLDYDWILLGWYHSHPGHTCFLSSTDIKTHTTMFKHPHQVAIVIDPINIEARNFIISDGIIQDIPLAIVGDIEEVDGIPLHIRSSSSSSVSHGSNEPIARAFDIESNRIIFQTPEILAMAIGILTGLAPILYQMITNQLQPHWFNTPTIFMVLIGYLTFLFGFQRAMIPIYNTISHPSNLGSLLVLFGITSAALLLLIGIWRLLTGAWEYYFAQFALIMGMITLIGSLMRPSGPPPVKKN